MARAGFSVTIGQSLGDGKHNTSSRAHDGGTSLASAVATAVADGATPTQAHVTAINTALTAYTAGDLELTYDTTKVTTLNQLKAACAELIFRAQAAGLK